MDAVLDRRGPRFTFSRESLREHMQGLEEKGKILILIFLPSKMCLSHKLIREIKSLLTLCEKKLGEILCTIVPVTHINQKIGWGLSNTSCKYQCSGLWPNV